MGVRRKAREFALQVLYQHDLNKENALEDLLNDFLSDKEVPGDIREFCHRLVKGTLSTLDEMDQQIRSCTENWSLERISVVDRNILRIAIYELFYIENIPVRVTLNEAIEIAKRFGQEDSASFINGVLDRVVRENKDRLIDKISLGSGLP